MSTGVFSDENDDKEFSDGMDSSGGSVLVLLPGTGPLFEGVMARVDGVAVVLVELPITTSSCLADSLSDASFPKKKLLVLPSAPLDVNN